MGRKTTEIGDAMHEYAFDITLRASLRMGAYTEQAARDELKEVLDCVEANLGSWPSTEEPILCEASIDGEPHLFEIDGEPTPNATVFHAHLLPDPAKCVEFVKQLAKELAFPASDMDDDGLMLAVEAANGAIEGACAILGVEVQYHDPR